MIVAFGSTWVFALWVVCVDECKENVVYLKMLNKHAKGKLCKSFKIYVIFLRIKYVEEK